MPMTITKRMRTLLPVVFLIHPLIHYEVCVNAAMMNVHDDARELGGTELALFNLDGPFSLKSESENVCLQVLEIQNLKYNLDLQDCDELSESQTFVYRSDYKIQSVSQPLLCMYFGSKRNGWMQYCSSDDKSNLLIFASDGSIQQMKDREQVVTITDSGGARLRLRTVNTWGANSFQKWKVLLQRPLSYPHTLLHQVGQDITLNTVKNGFGWFGFGWSVSLSQNGKILAAGAPGLNCVTVYELVRNENFGTTRWEPLGQTIKGSTVGNDFGFSLQLSADGHTLVVGEPVYENEVGRAQVFSYDAKSSENWIQLGNDIEGDEEGSNFGQSVTISGDGRRVAIGAPDHTFLNNGKVFVHVYDDTEGVDGWGVAQEFSGRDFPFHGFGHDVSFSGDGSTLACSAPEALTSGFVMVFKVNKVDNRKYGGRVMIKPESLKKSGWRFGWSISLSFDGSRIAVGSPNYPDSQSQLGRADIYESSGGRNSEWVPVGEPIFGSQVNGLQSGWSVSLSYSGNHVAIGAHLRNSSVGQAVVHEFTNGSWGDDLAIDGQSDEEWFGYNVDLGGDGTFLAVGGPGDPGASTKSGVVRSYEWR